VHRARGGLACIGQDLVGEAIGDDLYVAIGIGAEDRDLGPSRQRRQGFGRRMTILVAGARRDDGGGRPDDLEQAWGGRGRGPVMPDLQHIHARQGSAEDEDPLDWRLGVSGQQRGEATVADEQDDRPVVDVALGKWRRRIGRVGVEDLDCRARIERE
jgi:hypothetical protein